MNGIIHINDKVIDLSTLTDEQIQEMLNYGKPPFEPVPEQKIYLDDTLHGDGTLLNPYGVSNVPNTLTIKSSKGNISYDGSENVVVEFGDYKDVIDNVTIIGSGTTSDPLHVNDDIIETVNDAFAYANETYYSMALLSADIANVHYYYDKIDSAVSIAQSASVVANSAYTYMLDLYDTVAGCIVDLVYNVSAETMEVTFADGTKGEIDMSNQALYDKLKKSEEKLYNYVDKLYGTVSGSITDLTYDVDTTTIYVTFADGTTGKLDITNPYLESRVSYLENDVDDISSALTKTTSVADNSLCDVQKKDNSLIFYKNDGSEIKVDL